jgi:hypothetical protein
MNPVIFVCQISFHESVTCYLLFLGSLGILLYTLLAGTTPFALDRNDSHEVILARTTVKLDFSSPIWDTVTNNAKVNF